MTQRSLLISFCLVLSVALTVGAGRISAQPATSSDLLLPYFEVDLVPPGRTTLFAVGNYGEEKTSILIRVHTNWGIPVLDVWLTLDPDEVETFNLVDWLVHGTLPDRTLGPLQLEHLQAALCGEASPLDELYYSTETAFQRAVGYVTIRATDYPRPDTLWGDFFYVDLDQEFAEGEALVNLDRFRECCDLCRQHIIRFMTGGALAPNTEMIVWTARRLMPSPDPQLPVSLKVETLMACFDEPGNLMEEHLMPVMPLEVMDIGAMAMPEPFGWIELTTEVDSIVAVRYRTRDLYSVALRSWCVAEESAASVRRRIRIEKMTNGDDADTPPGPVMDVGEPVEWTYRVSNPNNVTLTHIQVSDDQGVSVACPGDELGPGELMVCTASGVAAAGQYRNVGMVFARTPEGAQVSDSDPSHCFGRELGIHIEKLTNGEDADAPPGPVMLAGMPVMWTYVVTNTSNVPLSAVAVTDDQGETVTCPKSTLGVGESMICTAHGTAGVGQYSNVGSVVALTPDSEVLSDSDPSHCFGQEEEPEAAINLEKLTNGFDADSAPGPVLPVGHPVVWTYVVSNTGTVPLTSIAVTDSEGVAVVCPKTELAPGESMTCEAHGIMGEGQHSNIGEVVAEAPDATVLDATDPSHCFGEEVPEPAGIDIEKLTNGFDADSAPGPVMAPGDEVVWHYVVVNTGQVPLTGVTVTDSQGVAVTCPKTELGVGEWMMCTALGTAVCSPPDLVCLSGECETLSYQYENLGEAAGVAPDGSTVSDSDPSHYYCTTEPEPGDEGCTPGYWKNHPDSWGLTGYTTGETVSSVFAQAAGYPGVGDATLMTALDFGGGPGVDGAARILMRAAVAAVLNAAHPGVAYPYLEVAIIADTDAALASGDRDTMLLLAASLDAANNLGCPLN